MSDVDQGHTETAHATQAQGTQAEAGQLAASAEWHAGQETLDDGELETVSGGDLPEDTSLGYDVGRILGSAARSLQVLYHDLTS